MKYFSKLLSAAVATAFIFSACDKVDDLPKYANGTPPVVLTASAAAVAPVSSDSDKKVITFSWTDPKYANVSGTTKYTIEIDSTGRNFSKAVVAKVAYGRLDTNFLAKELNYMLLNQFGYAYNTDYGLDVRVISSYSNNNERYYSNTVKFNFKTYTVPPKIALPGSGKLWLNGGAATWSWTGAPPMPQSEFSKIDSVTFGGTFYLSGAGQFLVLGQNGGSNPYDQKYAIPDASAPFAQSAGDFKFYPPGTGGDNFKAPNTSGWYNIIMNFQTGKYTISSFGSNALPQDLWITGNLDAFPNQWVNNPPSAQKFTRLNSSEYSLTIAMTPGKVYKFLSSSGNWQPQFGGTSGSTAFAGTMGANYGSSSDPDVINTPATAGNYKITVNFTTNTYKVVAVP